MGRIGKQTRPGTFATSTAGTAAVEFAVLSPLYLLMMLGMTAYGIYFGASHSVQQIAADAARTAVAGLDETERRALATSYIERNADGYLFIDPRRLSVDVADAGDDARQFVVRVSYDAGELPIWGLFERLSMPGRTITRGSTIRIGGL